jgi:hypothetical protein
MLLLWKQQLLQEYPQNNLEKKAEQRAAARLAALAQEKTTDRLTSSSSFPSLNR